MCYGRVLIAVRGARGEKDRAGRAETRARAAGVTAAAGEQRRAEQQPYDHPVRP